MTEGKLFKVVITAIVVKDGKYLILKRSPHEKKFPQRWTVPGGKLTTEDYVHLPKDTPNYWYNVLEQTLKREVKEEAGIDVKNIRYITSLADAREDDNPSLVISCLADYDSGEVALNHEHTHFAWADSPTAKTYDLIEGIEAELLMADRVRKGEKRGEWSLA